MAQKENSEGALNVVSSQKKLPMIHLSSVQVAI